MYNTELEQAIIGALIMKDIFLETILEEIRPEYFYHKQHQDIFNSLLKKIEKEKKINQLTIKNDLEIIFKQYNLDNYLKVLLMAGSDVYDVKGLCLEIKNIYGKRELKKIIDVCNDNLSKPLQAFELMNKVKDDLDVLENEATDYEYSVKSLSEIVANRLLTIQDNINNNKNSNYLKTDFMDFDRTFSGIPKKQLTILGGCSSMGKTTFALQIALNISQKENVLFFSQEMGNDENADKVLSNINKINSIKFRDSNLSKQDLEKVMSNADVYSKKNLYIIEKQGIDADYILKTCKRFERKVGKIGLIIVDHLQITNDSRTSRSRVEELGNITLDFKEIAKKYNCGFILLSQLSREVDKRESPRPELSDLRESGRITENADLIMFIYRREYYLEKKIQGMLPNEQGYNEVMQAYNDSKGKVDIMVKKYRNGANGSIMLSFKVEYSLFEDLSGGDYGSY